MIPFFRPMKCSQQSFDTIGPTRTLSELITDGYVQFYEKHGPKVSRPDEFVANTYEKLKKSSDSFSDTIKCSSALSDAIGPAGTLIGLVTDGYLEFSKKNGYKSLASPESVG